MRGAALSPPFSGPPGRSGDRALRGRNLDSCRARLVKGWITIAPGQADCVELALEAYAMESTGKTWPADHLDPESSRLTRFRRTLGYNMDKALHRICHSPLFSSLVVPFGDQHEGGLGCGSFFGNGDLHGEYCARGSFARTVRLFHCSSNSMGEFGDRRRPQ